MSRCFAVALVGLLAASPVSFAQSPSTAPIQTREHAVRLVTLTEGLERPWGLAFLPDGRMLVTEKAGRLRVVGKDGKLDSTPVAGLPRVDAQGQGGLLDVALHPDYAANGWVYWTYSQRDAEGRNGTELARGKLAGTPGAQRMEQVEVLFRMAAKTDRSHHFGSRIVFDAKQGQPVTLYVTLGDRGEMQRAQALDDHAGKILRLTDDGKPAPGNPFLNDPKARAEIFSLGNRNVQGAALHPQTGVLWAHEHGPQGGDELNVIKAGTNYGWPVITYGVNYVTGTKIGEGTTKAGMAQPVKHWPSGFSPSGMAFYTGERFPKWRGDVLMGALRGQGVMRVRLDGERAIDEEMMLTGSIGRVRDVRVGPDGLVYLLTDLPNGGIVRIEPVQ